MAFYGRVGIAGTTGIKAAMRTQHGTQDQLVGANGPHHESAHRSYHRFEMLRQCFSRLARRSFGSALRAESRAETMTSTAGRACWFNRKDSRVRRLIRLRATAVPKVRVAMAKPKRGQFPAFANTDMLKYASDSFLPRCRTERNSAGRCKRLRGSNVTLLIDLGIARKSGAVRLRAEALAALRAAAGQQISAALGRHSRTETVGAGTMQITGVKSTFHGATSGKMMGQIKQNEGFA